MSSELVRLREVMNKLRSPGGCPWDAEQDHASLLKYLLEESYEFIESVENNLNVKYHKIPSALLTDRNFLEKIKKSL